MKRTELGRTGTTVSQVALGCMLMGTYTDQPTSYRMLDAFLGAGGDFLDTANCYSWWHAGSAGGESEELLGRWMADRGTRDDVFLATKVGGIVTDVPAALVDGRADWDVASKLFEGTGADVVRRGVDASLRRLGTDHVDLYYVHVDDPATPLEETLEALDGIVRAGKARHIGWSNVRTWRLERIRQLADRHGWTAPVAVQQQHSYLRPAPRTDRAGIAGPELLDYLTAHDDLSLVAYSPILQGIYDDPDRRAAHRMWSAYSGPDSEARLAVVGKVAADLGVTGNQVALAWLLHQRTPAVVPIVGTRTWEQFEAFRPALDVELGAEHLASLEAAGA
ncbi:aldo/keto reductase [Umezawaea endophytica]|uniref:Aldo/keto reductase n=1 Tax=Umezawaea endophytica TaxID=1654476 RepID=A0A9X2VQ64_9PSEU|nr:aldo/keto reductase [Umezawaea endophytica]MCS7479423.1 aldo/keto reductase [Umezawaea endophytica]